jgi:hypothetical protein
MAKSEKEPQSFTMKKKKWAACDSRVEYPRFRILYDEELRDFLSRSIDRVAKTGRLRMAGNVSRIEDTNIHTEFWGENHFED